MLPKVESALEAVASGVEFSIALLVRILCLMSTHSLYYTTMTWLPFFVTYLYKNHPGKCVRFLSDYFGEASVKVRIDYRTRGPFIMCRSLYDALTIMAGHQI